MNIYDVTKGFRSLFKKPKPEIHIPTSYGSVTESASIRRQSI